MRYAFTITRKVKMETEIEAKWLDIDPNLLRKKLSKLGATLEHKEKLMKRKVFDFPDLSLEAHGGWVRVRDEGDKITMSYKQLNDRTVHGTKEVTLKVNDFEKACIFLKDIGLESKSYQETKREKWILGDCEITIDTWPWIPTFVEIEAPNEKELQNISSKLDLEWKAAMHGSVETAYMNYYNVGEKEVDHWDTITFVPIPEWLEKTRRK